MPKLIIHVPKLQLSGGNLVSMELVRYLSLNGIDVVVFSGYKFYLPHEVFLVKNPKGTLNTFTNLVSFLSCSIVSLCHKNTIATHHLTALFNFIKPTKYAFIQDVESNFYPKKLRLIGSVLWKNYLKSLIPFSTNTLLCKEVDPCLSRDIGVSFICDDLQCDSSVSRPVDVLLILRDGDYKSPSQTVALHKNLLNNNINSVLVNASRIDSKSIPGSVDAVNRVELLSIFNRTKIFICLSEWEGLGLPNIESYINGCTVMSTNIPSLQALESVDYRSVFHIEKTTEIVSEIKIILDHYSVPNELEIIKRKELIKMLDIRWKRYIDEIFEI
jgi:hypothetical protein